MENNFLNYFYDLIINQNLKKIYLILDKDSELSDVCFAYVFKKYIEVNYPDVSFLILLDDNFNFDFFKKLDFIAKEINIINNDIIYDENSILIFLNASRTEEDLREFKKVFINCKNPIIADKNSVVYLDLNADSLSEFFLNNLDSFISEEENLPNNFLFDYEDQQELIQICIALFLGLWGSSKKFSFSNAKTSEYISSLKDALEDSINDYWFYFIEQELNYQKPVHYA